MSGPVIGHMGHIRIAIGAVVFGRWAAHGAFRHDDHFMIENAEGWVVTHVESGCSIPPDVINNLSREQAERIAAALEAEPDIDGFTGRPNPRLRARVQAVIERALAEIPDGGA